MDRQPATIHIVCFIAQQIEKLGLQHGNHEVKCGICIRHNEEQCSQPVTDHIQFHFIIGHDLTKLRYIKGSKSGSTANQYAFCSFARRKFIFAVLAHCKMFRFFLFQFLKQKIYRILIFFIILSYLGWVAAQVSALGLVLNLVTEGAISVTLGMVIGTLVVLLYTMYGGMWSVALTDFFQMILIVVGLVVIAFVAGDMAGGADKVITYANNRHLFHALPEMSVHGWLFWISAAMTMMIGSIPQQDVFQRVMSAKSGKIAVAGPIIGGVFYIFFAMVPMFIVVASILVMPDVSGRMLAEDPQQLLPTMIRDYMPMWLRVLFFGAVLSAVMSTASATILAPSTTFVENVLKNFTHISEKNEIRTMRATVLVFTLLVLVYALSVEGTAIYDMVAMAYQFPVVGAFWPLVMGLYWKKATRLGAISSILLGGATWIILTVTPLGEVFPSVLGGFIVAGIGMIGGSLIPVKSNRRYVALWARESKRVEYRAVTAR